MSRFFPKYIFLSFILLAPIYLNAQLEAIADKVMSMQINGQISEEEKEEIIAFQKFLKFLREQEKKEKSLNGTGRFGFSGNENDRSNLFIVRGGISIDKGSYPYELDFSSNIETIFRNGSFQENVSNIDISFDYHHQNVLDGLALENFSFLSRFSDAYLGIEQKYEVGGGLNLNFYSSELTENGTKAKKNLDRKPKYETTEDGSLIKCYQDLCEKISNPKKLNEDEIKDIENARTRYGKSIKKKYSKLRASLMLAVFYELEKVNVADSLYFPQETLYFEESFPATNFPRWGLRPNLTYQPNDVFKLRLSPYFKLPVPWQWKNTVVSPLDNVDSRADYFLDIKASLTAKFTEGASISFVYRYLYDNAPRRKYEGDGNGNYALLMAQQAHHNYNLTFNFRF